MHIAAALRAAMAQGLDRLDAQLLLLHALGQPLSDSHVGRAWLLAHDGDPLPTQAEQDFAAGCQRRLRGEPLAYILGQKEFHGLALRVTPDVLVPRPDTETLVDWALDLFPAVSSSAHASGAAESFRALDLGTGSGAIALAVQQARPAWQVTATDASPAALAIAMANAKRLQLNLRFLQGDWLGALRAERPPAARQVGAIDSGAAHGYPDSAKLELFDLILSNPPYIEADDPHLADLRHEPLGALQSGPDGLHDIRRIIGDAPAHLKPKAWLLLEHGHRQAASVRALLQSQGFAQVQSRRDLAGIERCSGGQWLGSARQ